MRLALAAVALVALVLSPSVNADWLQDGGDAGRSGYLRDGGPAWEAVALVLSPPTGERWRADVAPLVYGREAIGLTNGSIIAVDLDSGAMRVIATQPPWMATQSGPTQPPSMWAIVGDRLFLDEPRSPLNTGCDGVGPCDVNMSRLRIVSLKDGTESVVATGDSGTARECSLAVNGADVYRACIFDAPVNMVNGGTGDTLRVQHIRSDGTVHWTWSRESDPNTRTSALAQLNTEAPLLRLVGVSAFGELVTVVTRTAAPAGNAGGYWDGWVLDRATGKIPGGLPSSSFTFGHFGWGSDTAAVPYLPIADLPSTAVGDDAGWARKERVPAIPGPGPLRLILAPSRVSELDREVRIGLPGDDPGARVAMTKDRVYAASASTLAAFLRTGEPEWDHPIAAGATFRTLPLLVDDSLVYAFVTPTEGGSTHLSAFDMEDGSPRWSHAFDGDVTNVGAGAGTILATVRRADGELRLVVLGTTAASFTIRAAASDPYPRAADIVRVDLGGTSGGVGGPATQFSADWGDGERTDWQSSPILEHGYNTVGDHTAHVFAGNDAGQVSSQAVDFHVGRAPPQNFLQNQFSDENQNRTFFILGAAGSGLVALFGVVRLRSRRDRLARELAALDDKVRAAGHDPTRVDRALDERRVHARALLLAHKLDEGQHAVLLSRIEELARVGRLDVVNEDLDFLPHRHVRALRDILQDGRVSSIERAHFLALLEQDATLAPEDKARARAIIEGWARHDAGGGA